MEKLEDIKFDGIESLVKLLSDKKIVIPAFIVFIIGLPFFFENNSLTNQLPQIILNYGEWIKFATYISFVILIANFFLFSSTKIIHFLKIRKIKKKLHSTLISLSQDEVSILGEVYFLHNNKLAVTEPVTISLIQKGLIFQCSTLAERDLSSLAILSFYSITPYAREVINKYDLFNEKGTHNE